MEQAQVGLDTVLDGVGLDALAEPEPPVQAPALLTPGWNLLPILQGTLALVDLRAMNLTALLLASLVALWTQLHAFADGAPAVLAWAAWGLLIAAIVVMARVMLPHRLTKLGDRLILSRDLPCQFEPGEEASVLAQASLAVQDELLWLRRHLLVAVVLALLALAEVVLAYVIQKG